MDQNLVLEEIGLTVSESKVYLKLLELGSESAGNIAIKSKTTPSKIYETLEKLIDKGLVSYITDKNIKVYSASHPRELLSYYDDKVKNILLLRNEIEALIPKLEERMKLRRHKSEASIYKGLNGLKTAFYEILDDLGKDDEVLAMGIPNRTNESNWFFVKLHKDLEIRKINIRLILSPSTALYGNVIDKTSNLINNVNVRCSKFDSASATIILGNRVIIFPKETIEPILFVIDNKDVADSFRIQFEESWKLL